MKSFCELTVKYIYCLILKKWESNTMIKNNLLIIFFMLQLTPFCQTVEEGIKQITMLEDEISNNLAIYEQKVSELKKNSPLLADKDNFESETDFISRVTRGAPEIVILRRKYVDDFRFKMATLRGRLYETIDIDIDIDPKNYNANSEEWHATVIHKGYQKEKIEIMFKISRGNARIIWENWEKVQKIGWLAIEPGNKVSLVRVRIFEPSSKVTVDCEFNQYMKFPDKEGEDNISESVRFSPDGNNIAFGCHSLSPRKIRVFNIASGQLKEEYVEPDDYLLGISYGTDDRICGGTDGWTAFLCNVQTGKAIWSFPQDSHVSSVHVSRNGTFFAICSGNKTQIVNIENGKVIKLISHTTKVNIAKFSPDGKYLVLGEGYFGTESRGVVKVFDTQNWIEVKLIKYDHRISALSFSPDGKYIAIGEGLVDGKENSIYIVDFKTFKEIKSYGKSSRVWALSFSPDGNYLGCAFENDEPLIYRTFLYADR